MVFGRASIAFTGRAFSTKGNKRWVCQGWVVDKAPTDLQNGPTLIGVVNQSHFPCTSVASFGLKPNEGT